MSAGAVFKILTNDGKADQMIMATQYLKDRICDIIEGREAAGKEDTLPTLRDIERSHVLHFQSKFKPFVALGYEYQSVRQQSGSVGFEQTVQFNIPQFGDFLSDSVVNLVFSACSYAAAALGTSSSYIGTALGPDDTHAATWTHTNSPITLPDGSTVNSAENVSWAGIANGVTVLRRLRFTRFVNEAGQTVSASSVVSDNIHYCDYPGERIFVNTKFEVNGNPLDEYDYMSYAFYRKFRLCADKLVSYNRNMGQELPVYAMSDSIAPGLRQRDVLLSGPQTGAQSQPALNLWIKLLFWFNLDHSQALVSAAIPSGQRFITFQTAKVTDMVFRTPAVWAEAMLVTDTFYTAVTPVSGVYTLVAGTHDIMKGDDSRQQLLRYPALTNGALVAPTIQTLNLYVNNIFTIPEIHDIYIERIGFSLIRVHRRHTFSVNTSSVEMLLSNFKYPIEFFYCGLRPDENYTGTYRDTDWHLFTKQTRSQILGSASNTSLVGARTINASVSGDTLGAVQTGTVTMLGRQYAPGFQSGKVTTAPAITMVDAAGFAEHWDLAVASSSTKRIAQSVRTLDTVGVTAHGVTLFNDFDSSFFNSYIPEAYGGGPGSHVLTSALDTGVLFINFCLHPYDNQPSGHVNTSRAREFYIRFASSVISSGYTGTFIAEASALNFLLVSDGSAVLRYTT